MTIIKEMIKQEGVGSFFKGLTPKVRCLNALVAYCRGDADVQILVVGPKLVFSYTLAQSLIPFFGKYGKLNNTSVNQS